MPTLNTPTGIVSRSESLPEDGGSVEPLLTTADLVGKRVYRPKSSSKNPDGVHKLGRVRACVFHPSDKRFVGILVRRPDAALMFKRKDVFVARGSFQIQGKNILIASDPTATDKAACKALGIRWDDCVLWQGMPVMTQTGKELGRVGEVSFSPESGLIRSVTISTGATANALLGKRVIPSDMIIGFRRGMGVDLMTDEGIQEGDPGAILVDERASEVKQSGGFAEKAGSASAVAVHKTKEAYAKVKPVATEKVGKAADVAGSALEKGAYALGHQLGKTKGMFASFKEEFDKASHGDD